jgi:hypothetical protein
MEEVTIEARVCTDCSTTIDDADELIIDEHAYCTDCAFTCYDCETSYAVNGMGRSEIGGDWYCWDCSSTCERCEDGMRNDDSHTVDGCIWCEYCWENYSYNCSNCDNSYDQDSGSNYVDDNTYCDSCYEDNCYYCDDCNESFTYDNRCACNTDDDEQRPEGRCCQAVMRGRFVHDYNCKPTPIFKGTSKHKMYLGFELEVEFKSDTVGVAQHTAIALDGIAYLKHDGSISNGFEIVTHPHTHQTYRENSTMLWDTIETLRSQYGGRSWDTDTCGLHIHLSRNGFSSGAHLHRFIAFVYHNAPHMMKFAGRKTRFARFNDVYTFDEYDRPVFSIKHKVGNPDRYSSERYSAVNTQNEHTIELRFFRGTMKTSGVLSALDLAQAMVEYTRELRLDDVKLGALSWEWFADYVVSNNGLYPDLYSRLDKIQSVDINNKILANA